MKAGWKGRRFAWLEGTGGKNCVLISIHKKTSVHSGFSDTVSKNGVVGYGEAGL